MPPFPIRRVLAEDIPRGRSDQCRILAREMSDDLGLTGSLTKSNAAIFRRLVWGSSLATPPSYLPTRRLLLTILHVNISGSFCDIGLKKFATTRSAFVSTRNNALPPVVVLLFVVDSTFFFKGGGDTVPSAAFPFSAFLFIVETNLRVQRGYDRPMRSDNWRPLNMRSALLNFARVAGVRCQRVDGSSTREDIAQRTQRDSDWDSYYSLKAITAYFITVRQSRW